MRREASGPALVDHHHRNVTDLLAHRVRTAPEHVAFGRLGDEGPVDVTTAAFDAECRALAAGLVEPDPTPTPEPSASVDPSATPTPAPTTTDEG